jgi:hypothetical protein
MNIPKEIAWHYTTGYHFKLIIQSEAIMPRATGVMSPDDSPAIWFSTSPTWESTATKGAISPDGSHRNMTIDEMMTHLGGLFRLGVSMNSFDLLPFSNYMQTSHAPRGLLDSLVKSGIEMGGDPNNWHYTNKRIPLVSCFVDQFKNDTWNRLTRKR